jgi:hypothetical protein
VKHANLKGTTNTNRSQIKAGTQSINNLKDNKLGKMKEKHLPGPKVGL